MTFLERRRYGGRMSPGFTGVMLGLYLAMFLMLVLPTVVSAETNDLCSGNFPCFSRPACGKAKGAFIECTDKCGSGRGYCYAQQDPIPLVMRIGSVTKVVDVGAYVEAVYTYSIGIASVLAAVMLMIGGIQWLTSAGDAGRVGAAKTRMTNAIVGLLLTVFAWVFLNTINPSLVRLQMPRVPMLREEAFVQCDEFKVSVACGQEFALAENEGVAETEPLTARWRKVLRTDENAMTDCIGSSCGLAGSEDGTHTCQTQEDGTAGTQPTTEPGVAISAPVGPYECLECTVNGQPCQGGIGANPACCGGYCRVTLSREVNGYWESLRGSLANDFAGGIGQMYLLVREADGICGAGANGERCYVNQTCRSGKCVTGADWSRGGWCSSGGTGSVCDSDAQCDGTAACVDYMCVPKVVGGYCDNDDDCPTGLRCDGSGDFCYGGTAVSGGTISTATCSPGGTGDEQCRDRYGSGFECMESGFSSARCTNGQDGSTCTENAQCQMDGGTRACQNGICVSCEAGNGCYLSNGARCGSSDCANESTVYCVTLVGEDDRGIFVGKGDSGEPCATGPCGEQGTCKTGLRCIPESFVCAGGTSGSD